jgi:hypothetical protein
VMAGLMAATAAWLLWDELTLLQVL